MNDVPPQNADTLVAPPVPSSTSSIWRGLFGFEPVLFLLLWLTLLWLGPMFFRDPGSLWHTALGEWMLSHGTLLSHDVFSFSAEEIPWIPQSWLAECLFAVIYRATGFDGQLLLAATLLASLYAWLGGRIRLAGLDPIFVLPLLTLTMLVTMHHFHFRPHLFTLVGIGWTLAWLCDVEAGRRPLWHLWALVPGYALWANLHGGWLGGMATFGFVGGGWVVYKLLGWQQPLKTWSQVGHLLALGSSLMLTMFATPYGLAMPQTWLGLMGSPVLPVYIQEHQPLFSHGLNTTVYLVLLVFAVYVIALLGTFKWPSQIVPRATWLVVLVWFVLGISRQRNITLFALTVLVVLPDLIPKIRFLPWLATRVSDIFRLDPAADVARPWRWNCWSGVLPATVVLTALGLQLAQVPVPLIGRRHLQLDRTLWPVELIPRLQHYAATQPAGTPIFNDMLMGGFLMLYTPELKIFIDDRCELYGDAGLVRFFDAERQHPDKLEAWADQYHFQWALVEQANGFDRYLAKAPGWRLIERVPAAALYERLPKSPPATTTDEK